MLDKILRLWYIALQVQVTGETPDPKKGAEGANPERWDETLRQKDCNLIQSWKDPGSEPGHRRG